MAQYANCGAMVKPITTPTDIPTFYGLCGLTENSVVPEDSTVTAQADSTTQQASDGSRPAMNAALALGTVAAFVLAMI